MAWLFTITSLIFANSSRQLVRYIPIEFDPPGKNACIAGNDDAACESVSRAFRAVSDANPGDWVFRLKLMLSRYQIMNSEIVSSETRQGLPNETRFNETINSSVTNTDIVQEWNSVGISDRFFQVVRCQTFSPMRAEFWRQYLARTTAIVSLAQEFINLSPAAIRLQRDCQRFAPRLTSILSPERQKLLNACNGVDWRSVVSLENIFWETLAEIPRGFETPVSAVSHLPPEFDPEGVHQCLTLLPSVCLSLLVKFLVIMGNVNHGNFLTSDDLVIQPAVLETFSHFINSSNFTLRREEILSNAWEAIQLELALGSLNITVIGDRSEVPVILSPWKKYFAGVRNGKHPYLITEFWKKYFHCKTARDLMKIFLEFFKSSAILTVLRQALRSACIVAPSWLRGRGYQLIDACESPPGSIAGYLALIPSTTEKCELSRIIQNPTIALKSQLFDFFKQQVRKLALVGIFKNETDCAICLTPPETAEEALVTKCGHQFHRHCVRRWLNTSPTCPLCREDLT